MTRKIIAFAGSKAAGKTTAFTITSEVYPNVHELTFAGHLKKSCSEVFNIDLNRFNDQNLKERTMEDPVYLDEESLLQVIQKFNRTADRELIRPFVGKMIDTPRQLLQFVGTEVLRKVDLLIHIKYAVENMPKDGIVLITDMRFLNEFEYFYENHPNEFTPFYIKNNQAEMIAESDTHPSERQLLLFRDRCKLLENNGTLQEFNILVKSKIAEIL